MGKGGGDPTYYRPRYFSGTAQPHRVSSTRRSEEFGGNGTTDAVDGLQYPSGSSPSSGGIEARLATEFAAKAGVPNPDSEGLGGLNEGSEKALVVQLHAALQELDRAAGVFHAVTRTCIALLLRCVRSLDYNLRKKLCEYILLNGEKAGQSSSKGNLAEGSDAPHAKRKQLWVSKNFAGVRKRNNSFKSEIRLPGMKNKFWLGTYKTEEEAAQAFQVGVDWRKDHRGSKSFNKAELDDLKKRAKKPGEHLSDDRPHHNVASSDLASSKGKAVASPELLSQRESPAQEIVSSRSESFDWESLLEISRWK